MQGYASDADADCRVRKAKGSFGIVSPIWRNSSFPNSLKVRIFKSNVTTKLQVLVNRCLRRNFHIYWPNTISNTNLCKMADMQQIDVIIRRHKWNPLDGIGRKKGRPCETWRRTVERECKNLNKIWPDQSQEFGGELALLMPYVPVGIKETKKNKSAITFHLTI